MRRLALVAVLLGLGGAGALFFLRSDAPPLPPGFSSIREVAGYQDPKLLARAWALPVAGTFSRPLLAQTNPSSCGPASVANVLRSAGAPMAAEDVAAHGSGCVAGFCFGGLTLAQLGEAARAAAPGWRVTELHPETLEGFREELRRKEGRLIINFHRRPLFGAGGGHHSPIGGYLEKEDLVFVLDVNERFGPWLVPSARLFEAMDTMDGTQKRGLLRLCHERQELPLPEGEGELAPRGEKRVGERANCL
ncbi:MAG: phytochelatin synthase family protein [Archangium sp.]|nr:phytochelatin synthase family protein [Archangium sp.]